MLEYGRPQDTDLGFAYRKEAGLYQNSQVRFAGSLEIISYVKTESQYNWSWIDGVVEKKKIHVSCECGTLNHSACSYGSENNTTAVAKKLHHGGRDLAS